ncbi:MAG: hypothetical protein JWP57_2023 [Spirosoma sp.]|nr:hypothetical protein [Spirosoma sp.]
MKKSMAPLFYEFRHYAIDYYILATGSARKADFVR